MTAGLFPDGSRVSTGPGLGPTPQWQTPTPLGALLDRLALPPAPAERGRDVEVSSGLLVCGACGRWFPIEGSLPELLPDHLRDAVRERRLFDAATANAPEELRQALSTFAPSGDASSDPGAHYKKAEIGIKRTVDDLVSHRQEDPAFFGPGYSAPFNPWNSDFTLYLIGLWGAVVPLLNATRNNTVIDSGCGYSWTTEWLFRSGVNAIGIDICRTYLEIAVKRIGSVRPHLVVGDVENLPIASGTAHAVLAYESFHHIPDRRRAMGGYDRVLRNSGTVVLAEPGGKHEAAQGSVDVMKKFGILERGMELADVKGYAQGTKFNRIEQVYLLRMADGEMGSEVNARFIRQHVLPGNHVFRLGKGWPANTFLARAKRGVKRRVKAALRRMRLPVPK
jgi:SAM-dependent methyltransferase/uncharacterized protein YbaR (Trm112 family)